ncbi:membrane protein [Microtetraspora sp. NBRC 13810]|uniref:AEC family transporter n=1 Tax=Microtetraspora sp. NBRC 13810 TaxID=3030990 RepID=UPI0024A28A94|nr:AEC family transporter [Microtetraspora sp. NBRC 13810]GLW09662.1 membrane protein [Microtetraspora sp. NBRC 13810]
MSGVVAAFAALVSVALLGYLVGRTGVLRAQDELVLSRLAFYVATPALLFTTVATADLGSIFSPVLVAHVAGLAVVQAVVVVVAVFRRRDGAETTIGVLAASYVNAGNLGVPLGVYVLGDGALIAPILLFQLLVMAPVAFHRLDRRGAAGASLRSALRRPLTNPLSVASLLGLAVALSGLTIPAAVTRPIELVGAAAVPVALISYGLSLSGRGAARLGGEGRSADVALVVALKCFAHPAVSYLIGRYALGLDGPALLAATLFAALPTAQNVYVYAVHYDTGKRLARGAVFLSTLISIPVMLTVSGLLA